MIESSETNIKATTTPASRFFTLPPALVFFFANRVVFGLFCLNVSFPPPPPQLIIAETSYNHDMFRLFREAFNARKNGGRDVKHFLMSDGMIDVGDGGDGDDVDVGDDGDDGDVVDICQEMVRLL